MKNLLVVLFIMSFNAVSYSAEQPSPELVKEFLNSMNTRSTTELTLAPVKGMLNDQMDRLYKQLRVKYPTAQQDEIIKKKLAMISANTNKQFEWESLEQKMIPIYQQELTVKMLKESIAFYKSESGQAVLNKVPVIFQKFSEKLIPVQKELGEYINKNLNDLKNELDATVVEKK